MVTSSAPDHVPTALGLRAHPRYIRFAVVDAGDPPALRTVSSLVLPVALHAPEQLAFARTALLDVIREFGVDCAGIRSTEPFAGSGHIPRVHLEGVIQELLGAGAVPRYFVGPVATIGRLLNLKATDVRRLSDGELEWPAIPGWSDYHKEEREAVIAAVAALRIPRSRLSALAAGLPVESLAEVASPTDVADDPESPA